ncbi:MAG: type I pullulanase [Prevotella sp.]|nr:type I pullulanase [Prevotella sp.]
MEACSRDATCRVRKWQTMEELKYDPQQSTFTLFAPSSARSVKLRLYKEGQGGKPFKTVKLQPAGTDRWQATVKGDLKGRFYTFDMGRGECAGIFAKAVGVGGRRAAIIDLHDTDPQGWQQDKPAGALKSPADLVVYELHHRDFSVARPEAVHKGKFLALTEPWAIAHLKRLGVNAVHLLPSFDYASIDETQPDGTRYNWGYDPLNYNVPEGSYSTDASDPGRRIREFKQMVQALHKAGIRVILDVVYNHTFNIDESNFQRTYPDYFFRKNPDGTYSNGSGCGNETASEMPMMRQFMLESLRYWVTEYHIDGFRFDLMAIHDIETMRQIRSMLDEIDPAIVIYGEGWSAGDCHPDTRYATTEQLATKARTALMPGIAAFSDEMRDALRGPFSDDTKAAFLAGTGGMEQSLRFGIAGCISHPQVDMKQVNYSSQPWADQPTQMMAYVSCHDDMCLVDRLVASIPSLTPKGGLKADGKPTLDKLSDAQRKELIALDLLAQTAVFTSQGTPFLLAGEELLRDKKGVHNSFESPDDINRIDWTRQTLYPQVTEYYSRLIAMRQHHPAFRLANADLVRRHLRFIDDTPQGVVAFTLKGYAGRDDWRDITVVLNASKKNVSVPLPAADQWTVVCREQRIDEKGLLTFTDRRVEVGPQQAVILHR